MHDGTSQSTRPHYVAVSAQRHDDGRVHYRMLTIDDPKQPRLRTEYLGSEDFPCGHLSCWLVNLAVTAEDHAAQLAVELDTPAGDSTQLPLFPID